MGKDVSGSLECKEWDKKVVNLVRNMSGIYMLKNFEKRLFGLFTQFDFCVPKLLKTFFKNNVKEIYMLYNVVDCFILLNLSILN